MSNPLLVSLVPGDDWLESLTVTQPNGQPKTYAGWTIEDADITWPSGSIELSIDTSQAAAGVFGISAANGFTGALPYGAASTMLIKGRSPVGKVETIYYAKVDGVHVKAINTLTVAHVGTQGPRGKSLEIVEAPAALVAGFGYDGDTAIIRPTGAMWQKSAGAWSDTGKNFWGTLLQQGADQVQAATDAAGVAAGAAEATAEDRVATGQDRTATGEDREQTGLDRVATGQDRTQTGLDKIATADDRVQTGLDRAQTGQDRTATGGDVLSTGADVAAANAAKAEAIAQAILIAGLKAGVDTTLAAMVAALAGVTNLAPVTAAIMGAGVRALVATDIVAALSSDTAKDSDGGIWRWRARGSWFPEAKGTATRGLRDFFPKRPRIIGQPALLTVQDGDDVASPLWKSWVVAGLTGVAMLNGWIVYSSATGVYVIDMLGDAVWRFSTAGLAKANQNVASYNQGTAVFTVVDATKAVLASNILSGIALSIYPGTPVDPVRKLPTPAVAYSSSLDTGVVHWDGRAITNGATASFNNVNFGADGTLWSNRGNSVLYWSPLNEYMVAPFSGRFYGAGSGYPRLMANGATAMACGNRLTALGYSTGLNLLRHEPGSVPGVSYQTGRSSVAYVTSTYNTGYQVGQTLLALAESTADVTSLVGANPLFDDFSTYADTGGLNAAWPTAGTSGAGAVTLNAGRMALDRPASGDIAAARRSFSTVIGTRYSLAVDDSGGLAAIRIGSAANGIDLLNSTNLVVGTNVFSFVAKTTTTWVQFNATTIGTTIFVDNVRVDVQASDRSGGTPNHPKVIGTVTRAAVAAGAELAAYGGFSNANYLDVPLAMAVGTADFSFSTWIATVATSRSMMDWTDAATSGARFSIGTIGSGTLRAVFSSSGGAPTINLNGTKIVTDGVPHLVQFVRRGDSIELWVDGIRDAVATGIAAYNITNASAFLRLGNRAATDLSWNGTIALPRLSFTAPTPAQIRAMYAAELPMFQPGAKCLLTGTDSVQGLSLDDGTGLLRVHKSVNGTDVFNGLIRIATETMASENALGPEKVTNGDGSSVTGWTPSNCTLSIVGGKLRMTVTANGNAFAYQTITGLNAAASHLAQADYTINSANSAAQARLTTYNGPGLSGVLANTINAIGSASAVGAQSLASSGDTDVVVACAAISAIAGDVLDFDNISLREVTTLRLSSNNHKGGSAANDNVAIFTDAEAYFKAPVISLREAMDTAIGRPADIPVYDRTYISKTSSGVTSTATATVIGRLPMDKGEAGDWVIKTMAKEYGDPASPEFADFEDKVSAYRPGEGNVVVASSVQRVINRSTVTITLTIVANTTTNTLDITVVGVNPKNLEWGYEATFSPSVQQVAA
ncbi:LamG domain-containing protein [Mesorhizobium sp. ES1-1]|uniref:LamG domain-containing protein n=1 Tax=Mesorhizobium sp. ES1-1 TaxID=2876629 RepID=UPI001CC959F5|nr:LamG domain-containing protein [Mesorhizobium sp. ES1-1]MBZ9675140.1 LamG domain-containing protein [Mesorhizobium sp. ES1-1]